MSALFCSLLDGNYFCGRIKKINFMKIPDLPSYVISNPSLVSSYIIAIKKIISYNKLYNYFYHTKTLILFVVVPKFQIPSRQLLQRLDKAVKLSYVVELNKEGRLLNCNSMMVLTAVVLFTRF